MTPDYSGSVLYDVVDEIGIDVDRFRFAQGASRERLYLTGIEFALAVAGFLSARFIRGFVRGLKAGVNDAGLDPDELGERLGRWTMRTVDDRAAALVDRAEALLVARPDEVHVASAAIGAEAADALAAAQSFERELPDEARGQGLAQGLADLTSGLIDNGWTRERAEELAERIAVRLLAAGASG